MKLVLTIAFLFMGLHSFSQSKDSIKIPEGIVYRYESKDLVDKAKTLIGANIKDNSKYDLCGQMLIVGPVLWKRYKNIDELKNIEGGDATFMVDSAHLAGKMSQTEEDSKKVWDAFRKEMGNQPFTIRKLNENELKYYWSVISFDIDEPLFIVETKEHRYILNISKIKMELMWLDEAP
jgi:hypothetical protein